MGGGGNSRRESLERDRRCRDLNACLYEMKVGMRKEEFWTLDQNQNQDWRPTRSSCSLISTSTSGNFCSYKGVVCLQVLGNSRIEVGFFDTDSCVFVQVVDPEQVQGTFDKRTTLKLALPDEKFKARKEGRAESHTRTDCRRVRVRQEFAFSVRGGGGEDQRMRWRFALLLPHLDGAREWVV